MSASGHGNWVRAANIVLGTWLIVASFLWPHTVAQRVNAVVVGGGAVVIAVVAAVRHPKVRYANVGLAIWLVISTLTLPGTASTLPTWNALFVAIAMIACSITPREPEQLEAPAPAPAH
ncbi:MAG TPA: hypothetical protein VM580_11365 [Labilithrix sp.]|nr:hypothetical protein [Labilithrix sp.]